MGTISPAVRIKNIPVNSAIIVFSSSFTVSASSNHNLNADQCRCCGMLVISKDEPGYHVSEWVTGIQGVEFHVAAYKMIIEFYI